MPQAYSPSPLMTPQNLSPDPRFGSPYIHSSLSPYGTPGPRYHAPQYHHPRPKRLNDPTTFDPLQLSDYILKVGPQGTSPIIAKLVLNHHVDGRTLVETPVDVIESISGGELDDRLRHDFMDVTSKLRAAARGPVRDVRMSARLIARELEAYTPPPVSPVPSAIHSDGETPPPSPTVSEWDFNEDADDAPAENDHTTTTNESSAEQQEQDRPLIVIDTALVEPVYEPLLHMDQPASAVSLADALSPLVFPSLDPTHDHTESVLAPELSYSSSETTVESDEEAEETELSETEVEMETADEFESLVEEDEEDEEDEETEVEPFEESEDEEDSGDDADIEDGVPTIPDEDDNDQAVTVETEECFTPTEIRQFASCSVQADAPIPVTATQEVEIQTDICPHVTVDMAVDTTELQAEEDRKKEEERLRKAEAEQLERQRVEEVAKRILQERAQTLERRWQERERQLQEERRRKQLHKDWEQRELRLREELTRDPSKPDTVRGSRRKGRTARRRQQRRSAVETNMEV